MTKEKELVMSFDPKTIEHLGLKMYSHLPNAIAELIANSYDACANNVAIKLYDQKDKVIIVEDDGIGMSFDDINDKFLRIGRNRREEEGIKLPCGRIATGKKGLGKLAFFGIGNTIEIITESNGSQVKFILDWDDLMDTKSGEDYKPKYERSKSNAKAHGTKITLSKLKRKTVFDSSELANSLAKLFDFPDAKFGVILTHNDKAEIVIDNKLKYAGIEAQFEWAFPGFTKKVESSYADKPNIKGNIITTEKPLKPGLRGITLFANGRMVNKPEFFGSSESSHFFSYTTGWLDVDFVDNWDDDVISTNRQSLDWENQKTIELKDFLHKALAQIHLEWKGKRKEEKIKSISEKTGIDINQWYEKLPSEIQEKIYSIVTKVVDEAELPKDESNKIVENIHYLIPEYPDYHWRHLHPKMQPIVFPYYERRDYYHAVLEGVKNYINEVKTKSKSQLTEMILLENVFAIKAPKLSVTAKFRKPNGDSFKELTIENIAAGHRMLAIAMWQAFRSPIAHEEVPDLKDSGLFTEKDCLDGLSLLSHLYKRLEDAQ